MQKIKRYPLLILFTLFLFVTTVADMCVNNRVFSEMENKYLTQKPAFSWSQLFKNQYTPKYETYINDQFVGRDWWITVKSVSESAFGKIKNNGIVYGSDHYLFEEYLTTDEDRIERNIGFLNEFVQTYGNQVPVTVSVIPSSYAILGDYLPTGLHNVDQRAYCEQIRSQIESEWLDLFPVMTQTAADAAAFNASREPNEEELLAYYRTDHHWTSYGAYRAYQAFAASRGKMPVELETLKPYLYYLPDFYGSYFSKCKLYSALPDTIAVYDLPVDSVTVGGEQKPTLHNTAQWGVRDKHAGLLWGNADVTVIKSRNNRTQEDGKTSRVLLFKDSFGNSFAPFLTYNYDEVYVVDLRSNLTPVSELMSQVEFDDVLILYNFLSFSSSADVARITY